MFVFVFKIIYEYNHKKYSDNFKRKSIALKSKFRLPRNENNEL